MEDDSRCGAGCRHVRRRCDPIFPVAGRLPEQREEILPCRSLVDGYGVGIDVAQLRSRGESTREALIGKEILVRQIRVPQI